MGQGTKTDEFSDNFQTAFVLYHSVIIYLAMIMSRSFFCHRHEKLWKLDESENVKEEPKPKQLSNFAPLGRSVAARRIVDEVAKWGTTTRNMRQIGPGEKNI